MCIEPVIVYILLAFIAGLILGMLLSRPTILR